MGYLAVVDEGYQHRDGERVEEAVAREGVGRDVEHLVRARVKVRVSGQGQGQG